MMTTDCTRVRAGMDVCGASCPGYHAHPLVRPDERGSRDMWDRLTDSDALQVDHHPVLVLE